MANEDKDLKKVPRCKIPAKVKQNSNSENRFYIYAAEIHTAVQEQGFSFQAEIGLGARQCLSAQVLTTDTNSGITSRTQCKN